MEGEVEWVKACQKRAEVWSKLSREKISKNRQSAADEESTDAGQFWLRSNLRMFTNVHLSIFEVSFLGTKDDKSRILKVNWLTISSLPKEILEIDSFSKWWNYSATCPLKLNNQVPSCVTFKGKKNDNIMAKRLQFLSFKERLLSFVRLDMTCQRKYSLVPLLGVRSFVRSSASTGEEKEGANDGSEVGQSFLS